MQCTGFSHTHYNHPLAPPPSQNFSASAPVLFPPPIHLQPLPISWVVIWQHAGIIFAYFLSNWTPAGVLFLFYILLLIRVKMSPTTQSVMHTMPPTPAPAAEPTISASPDSMVVVLPLVVVAAVGLVVVVVMVATAIGQSMSWTELI